MELLYIEIGTSIIITITVTISTFIAFNKGYKEGLKTALSISRPAKEINEKEQLEIKRRQEGLKNIMDYDYSKAIERGVK